MFPLGQLVQHPKQVDAREEISPAIQHTVSSLLSTTTTNKQEETSTHRSATTHAGHVLMTFDLLTPEQMGFPDSGWNISTSRLLILTVSVFLDFIP